MSGRLIYCAGMLARHLGSENRIALKVEQKRIKWLQTIESKLIQLIYFRKWNFNLIPQIIEKSASIFRWVQSIFRHTHHFVAAKNEGYLYFIQLDLIKILYYVKFNRVERYSRATPPLSGPDNPFGLPCQRGYKNKWTF